MNDIGNVTQSGEGTCKSDSFIREDDNELYKREFKVWMEEYNLVIKSCDSDISEFKESIDRKLKLNREDITIIDKRISLNTEQKELKIQRLNLVIEGYNEWAKREGEPSIDLVRS